MVSTIYAFEKGEYDYRTVWRYSGDSVTVGWDPADRAIEYDVIAIHLETGTEVVYGTTTNLSMPVVLQRVGHYILKVRSANMCNGERQTSDWSSTIDSFPADGKPTWIYCQLAPATDLNIH